ncbi:MAG: hypothetical protein BGO09_15970 [Bacteroidetes bacterium 47-18]|nr:MAG: hypothetical protein BGO09_15970 [Bacteroidetes bacterium 47-18]
MNTDFLFEKYWDVTLLNYIIAGILLLTAFTLRRYLSNVLSKIIFSLLGKYADKRYLQLFQELVLHPFQGLIVTNFFYLAVQRVSPVIDDLTIIRRAASKGKEGMHVTLLDVIDLVFYFCLIFYVALLFSRILDFISRILIDSFIHRGDKVRQQVYPLVRDILKVLIWTISVFTILKTVFQVDVTALVAGLGIGGIAVAFALKDSLENLLASILIMIDKPFLIGDWVKVNGVEGVVEKLGFRHIQIRSFDKTVVSIPNKKLIDNNLENFSERGMRRVKFELGAVYGLSEATLKQVSDLLKEKIEDHPQTVGSATIQLDNFGDSSVNFAVAYFVQVSEGVDFGKVKEDINYIIYDIMYRYARGFPYPTATQLQGEEINEVTNGG